MSLIGVKLAEQINLQSTFALLIRQLCQLHHQHQAEERQFLVLMVENKQRKKIFLKEVPTTEFSPYERLFWTVELKVLKELLETLLTVLVFDIDI